ncbi:MAG: acetyltransferase [Clostridia bacterium]|nr:acetyltransferase [Clostridia bacterium]
MCCRSTIDRILLLGNGGHCSVVIESLRRMCPDAVIGLVAKDGSSAPSELDVPIVGCDQDVPRLFREGWRKAFVTLGSIGHPETRIRLASMLKVIGFELPGIIDPTASVSRSAQVGEGVFIGPQAAVNAQAVIGANAIINTGAIVEHQCRVEDFVHVAPAAVLCGGVRVGYGAHIGARAVVKQGLSIGEKTIIGLGSVVTRDIPAGVVAYGCPCVPYETK